jgi:anti-anti-sigma regulatory factor
VRALPDRTTPVVAVTGSVDVFTADELSRELLTLSGGGTLSLTVDLTGASQLASAGVSALFRVRRQLTAQLQELQLVAVPGSSVAAVLDLVRLPFRPGPAPGDDD